MNSSIASPPAKGRSLKYLELADHFRQQVASGELRPGHQQILQSFGSPSLE